MSMPRATGPARSRPGSARPVSSGRPWPKIRTPSSAIPTDLRSRAPQRRPPTARAPASSAPAISRGNKETLRLFYELDPDGEDLLELLDAEVELYPGTCGASVADTGSRSIASSQPCSPSGKGFRANRWFHRHGRGPRSRRAVGVVPWTKALARPTGFEPVR